MTRAGEKIIAAQQETVNVVGVVAKIVYGLTWVFRGWRAPKGDDTT